MFSVDLTHSDAVPYFMWDDPMTVAELRQRLATISDTERMILLGRILREARDSDVWHFTSPTEVAHRWNDLRRHAGRKREFWEWLLEQWRQAGLLDR